MSAKVPKEIQNEIECKQCHGLVAHDETIAYHLVNRILYGWCLPCFGRRAEFDAESAVLVPA
jgi:hypothetical protein